MVQSDDKVASNIAHELWPQGSFQRVFWSESLNKRDDTAYIWNETESTVSIEKPV